MQLYESLFIIKYDYISNEYDPKNLLNTLNVLSKNEIKILNHEYWGLKDFAYPIKRKKKGYYVLVHFELPCEKLPNLHKKCCMKEDIIRFMMLKIKKLPEKPSKLAEEYLQKLEAGKIIK